MRMRHFTIVILLSIAIALPALASMTSPPSTPPQPTPPRDVPGNAPADEAQVTARKQAEKLYASAYDDVAAAKKELDSGKEKNAQKKFKKALERADEATRLDDKYAEAWNLVGFASRKLGDYDRALKAYERCLDLKPDYAAAREYLGEAYLELGNLKKTREQLIWLDHLGATEEHDALKKLADAYEAAHPDSAAAAKPAPAGGQ